MEEKKGFWGRTVLYNLAWLISSLFVIVDLFMIREATLAVMTAIQVTVTQNAAEGEQTAAKMQFGNVMGVVDRAILFLGGVLVVALAIGIEYYYRKGNEEGKVWQRVGRVAIILAVVFVVSVLIQTFV
jgi:hypothetical protein